MKRKLIDFPSLNKKENIYPKINLKIQTPLFKIFMDNSKRKKINLLANSLSISKEENIKKMKSKNIY